MVRDVDGIQFFDGAASGQQRSGLMRIRPDAVVMSFATASNPWDNEYQGRDDYRLFTDSGGYHHMATGSGEYERPDEDYLDYIHEHEPELWALRDYPCEDDLLEDLGRTVADHQERTLNRHIDLLDAAERRGTPGEPLAVLQGWTARQYLTHLDMLRDHGCLTEYVCIGTLCRRDADRQIAGIIRAVDDAVGGGHRVHAFGVKKSVLRFREVLEAIDSADSQAADWSESRGHGDRDVGQSYTYVDFLRAYLQWRHDLVVSAGTESLDGAAEQADLGDF